MGFLREIFWSGDTPKNGTIHRFFMGNSSSGKRANNKIAKKHKKYRQLHFLEVKCK